MVINVVDGHTLAVFIPASIALILAPGPDTIYVLTRSIGGEYRMGLSASLGILTGVLVHITAAVLGLSLVLRNSAVAYTAVKYVGAAYLIYLGFQEFRTKGNLEITGDGTDLTTSECYRRGVLIDALNPKVAVFFLAFLPQFVDPGPGASFEMMLLGLLFSVLAVPWLLFIVTTASKVKRLLTKHPSVTTGVRWIAGTILVALGVELPLQDRLPS